MQENLKKGIMAIFSANIINLVFNLLTNFLLPKYLSVESYAAIKTFQLYTNYIGIFSLGYADGMYLRYGGRDLSCIRKKELKDGVFTFRLILILESLILIPLSYISKDNIILAFSFTVISKNMTSYFKNLYQAVGEFKRYGKILNLTTILTFVANMTLILIVKTDNFFAYLILYAIVDAVIWIVLEWNAFAFMNYKSGIGKISIKLLLEDTKAGFFLMVGNFSNILLSSMDRWFVKAMMTATEFAYYSFAVSLEGFLNIAITPITTTLYNYYCNHLKEDDVIKTRKYVLLFGTVIAIAAFPAKFIIENFLTGYKGAVSVLYILFSTQMIYVIIKGVYVNLYKAMRKQNLYFIRLVLILIIGAILNYLFVKVYPNKEAFAYATLISALIWLLFCIWDFKNYRYTLREALYLLIEICSYILLGEYFESIVGFLIYILLTAIMMFLLMNEEVKIIISNGVNFIKKK